MNLLAEALSAALIHSLWQNAIVAILLWMALVVLRQQSAQARYAVSCAALAVMTAIPIVTTGVLYARALPHDAAATTTVPTAAAVGERPVATGSAPATMGIRQDTWLRALQAWALPLWLVGILVCSLRLIAASAHAIALKRRSEPADDALASIVSALGVRIGVTRSVTVLISTMTGSPATLGWIRPVILLPPAAALAITPGQMEALLAHELAHIRRHDYLINVAQMIAETVFFYHPGVWWASDRIRVERELCCDDIAIDSCGDALGYAQALTRVARLRPAHVDVALGSSGGSLLHRIQRVLGTSSTGSTASPRWLIGVVLAMALVVMLTGVRAQSSAPGLEFSWTEGALRGQVIDAGTGRPVADASVRASHVTGMERPSVCPIDDCNSPAGAGVHPNYYASTDVDGHFEIRGVRPGDYVVTAGGAGHIQRSFGQSSDDMPEMPVHVSAAQTTSVTDIRLERAGAVSGRIFSDAGEGLVGVEVELLRRRYQPGGSRPVAVAFAQTEDLGMFRIRNIAPGEYYVRAYVPESTRPTRAEKSFAYAATYFPQATEIETAQSVAISSGQELFGIDVSLATMKMRVVSGRLVHPGGASMASASVHLLSLRNGPAEMTSAVAKDGRFRIEDVIPGTYLLTVADTAPDRRWNVATQAIAVGDDDVNDLLLTAVPSVFVDGRIMRDDGRPWPFDVTRLDVSFEQHLRLQMMSGAGRSNVGPDGTFSMESGTGTMYLQIGGLGGVPGAWNVKTSTLDGVDVTDRPFELGGAGRHRLNVVLTDRVVRVIGTVTDREARPVSNALVVVFPEDRTRWEASRLVRTTFSHEQGRYELGDIPAADYRLVAVPALPRGAWTDPEVLERLWPFSMAVRLQDGQVQAVPLKVAPAPSDLIQ